MSESPAAAATVLCRAALQGTLCFQMAVLQQLREHPVLVLRSGHLLLPEVSLLYLHQTRADLEGVVYGGGTIERVSTPEPVQFYHSESHKPSRHVMSPSSVVGRFLATLYGVVVVTGRGKWLALREAPQTEEGLERDLDQHGRPCESARAGLNAALDQYVGLLP